MLWLDSLLLSVDVSGAHGAGRCVDRQGVTPAVNESLRVSVGAETARQGAGPRVLGNFRGQLLAEQVLGLAESLRPDLLADGFCRLLSRGRVDDGAPRYHEDGLLVRFTPPAAF